MVVFLIICKILAFLAALWTIYWVIAAPTIINIISTIIAVAASIYCFTLGAD